MGKNQTAFSIASLDWIWVWWGCLGVCKWQGGRHSFQLLPCHGLCWLFAYSIFIILTKSSEVWAGLEKLGRERIKFWSVYYTSLWACYVNTFFNLRSQMKEGSEDWNCVVRKLYRCSSHLNPRFRTCKAQLLSFLCASNNVLSLKKQHWCYWPHGNVTESGYGQPALKLPPQDCPCDRPAAAFTVPLFSR